MTNHQTDLGKAEHIPYLTKLDAPGCILGILPVCRDFEARMQDGTLIVGKVSEDLDIDVLKPVEKLDEVRLKLRHWPAEDRYELAGYELIDLT